MIQLRLATPDDRSLLETWDQYQHVIDSGGFVDDEQLCDDKDSLILRLTSEQWDAMHGPR